MKKQHTWATRGRAVTVVVCAVAACSSIGAGTARAQSKEVVKCQRDLWKATSKYEQDRMKALQKCEENKLKGTVPVGTTCATEAATAAAISKARSAFEATINKTCGALTPTAIEFGTTCPDLPGAGCTTAISAMTDVVTCLGCVTEGSVDRVVSLAYGSLTAPGGDTALEKCKQTLGKESAAVFTARSKALQGCQDKMINGSLAGPCPDGKARDAIQKASDKAVAKISAACGNFTTAQIGAPAACPTIDTQGIGIACGGTIGSTADLVSCTTCAAEFSSLCTDCSHCGNGVNNPVTGNPEVNFNVGETCDDGNFVDNDGCPKTCEIRACVGSGKTQKVTVSFSGSNVAGLTVFLRYGENAARIPGRANEDTVQARVTDLPANGFSAVNDLDYALRVVSVADGTLSAGNLFTVEFDTCKKPKFSASDLECVVEDAVSPSFEPVAGVTCTAAFVK